MNLIDKIFLINLDEKTDRLEHFLNQCKIHNIPNDKFERFSAINGKTHNFTKEELRMFDKADFNNSMSLTPLIIKNKLMGNQLSHFYILLEMKKRNYNNIIILQDDIIFKNGFVKYIELIMKDMPKNAEIINLGMFNSANNEHSEPYDLNNEKNNIDFLDKQITNFVYLYKIWNSSTCYRVNPCSLAYIVTSRGCDNLLNYFYNNGFHRATDWNYNLYLQNKNIFYGSKYVLATGNNIFPSDIFVNIDNYKLEDLIDINKYYTDKFTTHSYNDLYNNLFNQIRNQSKHILEIGIGAFQQKNGGSLLLWKMYFKNALIHGVDMYSEDRVYDIILNDNSIKTYLNSNAYKIEFVEEFKKQNIFFDVIIDDGEHTLETNCKCVELYSNLLTNNGILIIEDIQDISWIEKIKDNTPNDLKKYIHIYDLRHIKNRYDDILFVINKNTPNYKYCDVNIPLVLSYENELSINKNAILFQKTLEHHKWEYKFIGEGLKWSGFKDRIYGYNKELNKLNDDKIIILSDSRDVFCLRNSDFLIEKIKDIVQDKIIISAEMFLSQHMNWNNTQIADALLKDPDLFWQGVPLDEYWDYHKINPKPFRKYVNAGLIIGKVKNLKNMFNWLIDNNYNDDQLGISKYTNNFPHLIHLDYEAKILHTSGAFVNGSLYNNDIQQKDAPTFHELFGFSTYFLHFPGNNGSVGQKYIYDTIYKLFESKIINKTMYEVYNLKEEYPINNDYFITNK